MKIEKGQIVLAKGEECEVVQIQGNKVRVSPVAYGKDRAGFFLFTFLVHKSEIFSIKE